MAGEINNINPQEYAKAMELFHKADTDGVKGLQNGEIQVFKDLAQKENLSESTINEILGLKFSTVTDTSKTDGTNGTNRAQGARRALLDTDFIEAIKYFAEHGGLNFDQRANITNYAQDVSLSTLSIYMESYKNIENDCEYLQAHPELKYSPLKIILEVIKNFGSESKTNDLLEKLSNELSAESTDTDSLAEIKKLLALIKDGNFTPEDLEKLKNMINDIAEQLKSIEQEDKIKGLLESLSSLDAQTFKNIDNVLDPNDLIRLLSQPIDIDATIETAKADNEDINDYLFRSSLVGQTGVYYPENVTILNFEGLDDEFKAKYADLIEGAKTNVLEYLSNKYAGAIDGEKKAELEDELNALKTIIAKRNDIENAVYDYAKESATTISKKQSSLIQYCGEDMDSLEKFKNEPNPMENLSPEMKFQGTRWGYELGVKVEYAKVKGQDPSGIKNVESYQKAASNRKKVQKTLMSGNKVWVIPNYDERGNVVNYTGVNSITYRKDAFRD